jgi:hypothetical protein
VDDHAEAPLDHPRQQRSVQSYGSHEVGLQVALPVAVGDVQDAFGHVALTAGVVDEDVGTAERVLHRADEQLHPSCSCEIGQHHPARRVLLRRRASSHEDVGATAGEAGGHRRPDPLRAAGDDDTHRFHR